MPYKDPVKERANAIIRTRRWRQRNPEYYRSDTVRRCNAAYKKRNHDKVKERARVYAVTHRQESKEYYQMNKSSIQARVKLYREENLERAKLTAKLRWHKKWDELFGWELGTHHRLWESAVACDLCGEPFDDTKALSKCTDHDHRTIKFRGIIHHKCNTVLGLLQDSGDHALRVADYLNKREHDGEI